MLHPMKITFADNQEKFDFVPPRNLKSYMIGFKRNDKEFKDNTSSSLF